MVSRTLRKALSPKQIYDRERKRLAVKAWKLWSKYIRTNGGTVVEYNRCYTCLKQYPWKELDAGHFFHTSKKKGEVRRWVIDYDERNIHPQCTRCNRYYHGSGQLYSSRLIEQYGDGIIQELHRIYQENKELSNEELQKIISKYANV